MSNVRCLIAAFTAISSLTVACANAPKVPERAPLTETQTRELLDGKTYEFVAYDEPLTGTTTWNYDKGSVSGSYVWKNRERGEYTAKWFLKDGKNCTQSPNKQAVCQLVYPYETGFMEVTPSGVVHAVSTPVE